MGLDAAPYDFDMLGGAEKDKVPPIEALQRAWVSERAAPELLRWEERGVDEVCAQIEDQAVSGALVGLLVLEVHTSSGSCDELQGGSTRGTSCSDAVGWRRWGLYMR